MSRRTLRTNMRSIWLLSLMLNRRPAVLQQPGRRSCAQTRSATSRGMVVIGGEKCPVIGRVSMDSIIVDTTKLKAQPRAGDWAEIIGAHQTVDEVAGQAGTIGYEILTSLGKRYKRDYTT